MTDAANPSTAPQPAPIRKRKWLRRLGAAVLICLALLVLARIAVSVALPPVMRKVLGAYGFRPDWERTSMHLVGGDVGLWHFTLTPLEGGEPVVKTEYARAAISTINLLRGRLVIRRLEADGVDLLVDRMADGSIPLIDKFLSSPTAPPPKVASIESMDLTSPLQIDAFRLNKLRARVRDQSVTPPLDATFDVNVRVSDVKSSVRPTRFEIELASNEMLDVMRIEGAGRAEGQKLDADVQIFIRGLHAKPAEGYLAPFGLKPAAGDISMRLEGKVKTWPATQPAVAAGQKAPPAPLQGTLTLSGVAATADLKQSLGLKRIQLDAESITSKRADFSQLLIEGVTCIARRTSDGGYWVGGIEFFPTDIPSRPTPATQPVRAPAIAQTPAPQSPIRWRLGEFILRDLKAGLRDEYVQPNASVTFDIQNFSVKNIVCDPTNPEAVATIDGTIHAPGIMRSARITGKAQPFAPRRSIELAFTAEGIRPDALQPYLDDAGLKSLLADATFKSNLSASGMIDPEGRIAADLHIDGASLVDGGEPIVDMQSITIAGIALDPKADFMRVDSIDVSGPQFQGRRDASGAVAVLGMHYAPGVLRTRLKSDAALAKSFAEQFKLAVPHMEVGRLTWSDARVRFDDEFVSPAARIELTDMGVEIVNLRLDAKPTTRPFEPGTVLAWMECTGIAKKLSVEGTLEPDSTATTVLLKLDGTGITFGAIRPYLQHLGIEPALEDGQLQGRVRAVFRETDGSLALENIRFTDGSEELVGVDSLQVNDIDFKSGAVTVGAIQLDRPRATITRNDHGAFSAAGVRTLVAAPTTQPGEATIPVASIAASPTTAPSIVAAPIVVTLGKLSVNNGSIRWLDHAVAQPVDASLNADVAIDSVVLGKAADPARLKVILKSTGMIDAMDIEGTVSLAPDSPGAKLQINGSGIREGALAAYLPPGTKIITSDGRFRATLDAGIAPNPQGGYSARLILNEVDWRDGADGPTLFGFDEARVLAPRLDPGGNVIAVDEIFLAGMEAETSRGAGGGFRAMGIAFEPPAATTDQADVPPAPEEARQAPVLRTQLEKLPLVTLAKLDVNVKRLAFVDEARPQAAPIALRDFSIKNVKPIALFGDDPAAHEPAEITIAGKIDPVVDAVNVNAVLAPFASEAVGKLNLEASGIRGDGLLAVAPELRDKVDGSQLVDGRFASQAEATLRAGRRGLIDFDPTKPFTLDFTVKETGFRGSPDGPVLAGLEEIRSEGVRFDPPNNNLFVKSLQLTKPMGLVVREADGIHVLGLIVKFPGMASPNGGAAPAPSEAEQEPPAQIAANTTPAARVAGAAPIGEIRIDRLVIDGIDFRIEDRAVDPPLVLPLTGLDLEMRGLSSRAMVEDRPVRFSALLNSGKAPLPTPKGQTTEREIFAQAGANGNLSLYPQPKGWVKSSISGLELVALAGEAKQADVDLKAGIFDGSVNSRFPGDGSMDNRVKVVFTDLKVTEPPNGAISKVLVLPQSLDFVIQVMEDPSGGITIPLDVPIEQGEINRSAVVGSVVGAMGGVIATGIASAPIKLGTSIVGGGEKGEEAPEEPIVLAFAPGEAGLSSESLAALQQHILDRLRDDRKVVVALKHELSAGDIARATTRANPSTEDLQNLVYRLQQKKLGLQSQRAAAAGRARGDLASRTTADAEASVAQLRGIDREIAATDDLIDGIYDLLRPGADRQANRRARAAAIAIGEARLNGVRELIISDAQIDEVATRVRVTRSTFAAPDASIDPNLSSDDSGGRVIATFGKRPKK